MSEEKNGLMVMPSVASISELEVMANHVIKSGLFPQFKTPAAVVALMLLCQAEGLHPMQAARRYHIIEGKPSMSADTMLAEFQKHGGAVKWLQASDLICEAVFQAPGVSAPLQLSWTIEQAKKAGLLGKNNWATYPRAMLRSRVVTEGIRMVMPGILLGIYSTDEVADMVTDAPPSPSPAPAGAPPVEPEPPAPAVDTKVSPADVAKIQQQLGQLGFKERDARLGKLAKIVGFRVESSKDLTPVQAGYVMQELAGEIEAVNLGGFKAAVQPAAG